MAQQVLIIDDDKSFKKILELKLKSFLDGLEITYFDNTTAARNFLKSNTTAFDLVILDQHLPDGRGADLLNENLFEGLAVLSMSSDPSPEVPGTTIKAGANFFLSKTQVTDGLFEYLVKGLIDRNKMQRELAKAKEETIIVDTVKRMVNTLRHEINNPLGAVMGAAYLLKTTKDVSEDQKQAAELVEQSGKRIKHVLDQICQAVKIESVSKANEKVFHIPGDKPWGEE